MAKGSISGSIAKKGSVKIPKLYDSEFDGLARAIGFSGDQPHDLKIALLDHFGISVSERSRVVMSEEEKLDSKANRIIAKIAKVKNLSESELEQIRSIIGI